MIETIRGLFAGCDPVEVAPAYESLSLIAGARSVRGREAAAADRAS